MKSLIFKRLLSIAAPLLTWAIAVPTQASTALPMTISAAEEMFSLVAPDTGTTRPAYGGKLRVYGMALSTAVKTPEAGDVFSARYLRTTAQKLYTRLVELKQQRSFELTQPETLENVTITSERLSKIQQWINTLDSFPDGLDRKTVRGTLQKLNVWKGIKSVQKLRRDYTDGAKAQLDTPTFVSELVKDTDEKNLILSDGIKPTALTISLSAMLLRA